MSSRILRQGELDRVSPIAWKRIGGGLTASSGLAPGSPGSAEQDGEEADALRRQIATLTADMQRREKQAREEGFQDGEAAAANRLTQPLQDAIARLAANIEDLARVRRSLRKEAERDVVKLAVAIARRILRRDLLTDPEAILGVAKAAIEQLDARDLLRVRLHPHDAPLLRQMLTARAVPDAVEVIPDQGLARGALIIETTRGALDASIETQLEEIERGFTDLLEQGAR